MSTEQEKGGLDEGQTAAAPGPVAAVPMVAVAPVGVQPSSVAGCPPGLEYLAQIDQVVVKQQVEMLEVFTGFETNNRYVLSNSMGQQIFYAMEDTECMMRYFCGSARGFNINIIDNYGKVVMKVTRPFKCCAGCCWCATRGCDGCAFELQVEAPPGVVVGYVRQGCYFWTPKFHIMDGNRQDVFTGDGPCCICECPGTDNDFNIVPINGTQPVGRVAKMWSGFAKECFTKADNFCVSFPMDLSVNMKATLIGFMFLIDFMFFEQDDNNS